MLRILVKFFILYITKDFAWTSVKYFSFSLTSPGIAIFAKKLNPLIYIRWKLSNDLLNIYKEIYKSTARIFSDLSENTEFSLWVPKTTIAYKDFGYKKLNLILKEIYKINFKKFTIFNKKVSKSDKLPKAENGRNFCTKVTEVWENGQK